MVPSSERDIAAQGDIFFVGHVIKSIEAADVTAMLCRGEDRGHIWPRSFTIVHSSFSNRCQP